LALKKARLPLQPERKLAVPAELELEPEPVLQPVLQLLE
jgi:hypothetical protein